MRQKAAQLGAWPCARALYVGRSRAAKHGCILLPTTVVRVSSRAMASTRAVTDLTPFTNGDPARDRARPISGIVVDSHCMHGAVCGRRAVRRDVAARQIAVAHTMAQCATVLRCSYSTFHGATGLAKLKSRAMSENVEAAAAATSASETASRVKDLLNFRDVGHSAPDVCRSGTNKRIICCRPLDLPVYVLWRTQCLQCLANTGQLIKAPVHAIEHQRTTAT